MRILLGMSGGVDSTYAALKLKEEGHDVAGAVLVMHEYTETEAAQAAARSVGIPLYKIDCRDIFESRVVSNFISEYLSGPFSRSHGDQTLLFRPMSASLPSPVTHTHTFSFILL